MTDHDNDHDDSTRFYTVAVQEIAEHFQIGNLKCRNFLAFTWQLVNAPDVQKKSGFSANASATVVQKKFGTKYLRLTIKLINEVYETNFYTYQINVSRLAVVI